MYVDTNMYARGGGIYWNQLSLVINNTRAPIEFIESYTRLAGHAKVY